MSHSLLVFAILAIKAEKKKCKYLLFHLRFISSVYFSIHKIFLWKNIFSKKELEEWYFCTYLHISLLSSTRHLYPLICVCLQSVATRCFGGSILKCSIMQVCNWKKECSDRLLDGCACYSIPQLRKWWFHKD